MKILVTGGRGYLGARLVEYLANAGTHEVVAASTRVHEPETQDYKNVRINWGSTTDLENICSGIDVVICASGMNADDSFKDPVGALTVNGLYTARLLSAAIRKKVKKFVYFSSAHIYMAPLRGTITEATCAVSLHPYATSHKAGEDVVRNMHQRKLIEGIVIRLSNSFGSPANITANCWMLFVNDLCVQALKTGKMILKTSGRQKRDFISLTEACRATEHLLKVGTAELGDGVFNLGGEWTPSLLEMANRIRARIIYLFNTDTIIQTGEEPADATSAELVYSIEKLKSAGFQADNLALVDAELDRLLTFCKQNHL